MITLSAVPAVAPAMAFLSPGQGGGGHVGALVYLYTLLLLVVLALVRSVLLRRKVDARNEELSRANARLREEMEARERVQAELARSTEALEASEKRLRLALDAANDGLWEWNVQTGAAFLSPRWYTMLGYEPDELPASFETWRDLVHPGDRDGAVETLMHAVADNAPVSLEYRMGTKDGRWIWMLTRGSVVRLDGSGAAVELCGTNADITPRKEAELALRQASEDVERLVEQRTEQLRQANQRMEREIDDRRRAEAALRDGEVLFRQLMNNIDQAFWMRDLDSGDYVFVSPACEALAGAPLAPRSDQAFLFMDLVHPLDRHKVSETLIHSQDDALARARTEFRILRADGTVRWVSAGVFPVQDADGRVYRQAGTATDITRRKSMEMSLEMSQQRLKTIFNSVNEAIFIHDISGTLIDANDKALEMYSVTREQVLHMSIEEDLSGPDARVDDLPRLWSRVADGQTQFFPWQARRPGDGSVFPVEVYLCKVRLAFKDAILACITDVTLRQRAEAEVRTLSMAVEQSPVCVIITDPEGVITYANPATIEILGFPRHELIGASPSILRSPHQPRELYGEVWETIEAGRAWSGDICNRTRDGQDIWQSASISPIKDQDGRMVSYVAVLEDITERKRQVEHMRHMALHDTLTGLPNRVLFMDRLAQAIERVQRSNTRLAVLYIDLDKFKPVNDNLGHEAGDQVLREVARRFQGCVRKVDTVARIGGDEFVAVLQDVQGGGTQAPDKDGPSGDGPDGNAHDDVDIAARRILACFEEPFEACPGHELGASIGISICPRHGYNPDTLVQRADQAMYEAKQAGRNTFRYAE